MKKLLKLRVGRSAASVACAYATNQKRANGGAAYSTHPGLVHCLHA